jgi:AAA+ ATPase superfamily predicted ATPase
VSEEQPTTLFAREDERAVLDAVYRSGRAELVALYGRRRVGKTHLIREFFAGCQNTLYCEFTGLKDGTTAVQLGNFREVLEATFYRRRPIPPLRAWSEAFKALSEILSATLKAQKFKRAVIFLDELPWMATPKSGLIQALDYSWNTQLSRMPQVIVVVCGSAASWMLNNLIHAKGGLHNRITRRIRLEPFSIPEVSEFLQRRGFTLSLRAIIELYMAVGGVPHYLNQLDSTLSASQNVAALCFSKNGSLRTEFATLFKALFDESDVYERIVRIIASKRIGVTRSELLEALKVESGGGINRKLIELEESGFITTIKPYGRHRKGTLYRIIDPFVYFYFSWIESAPSGVFQTDGEKYWQERRRTRSYDAWAGYTFENVCLTHLIWIQNALNLAHINYEASAWFAAAPKGEPDQTGAQVDLLFDRDDQVITICEMKYYAARFTIDKAYAAKLKRKIETFQSVTKTRKQLQLVVLTLNGFNANAWSAGLVDISQAVDQIFDIPPWVVREESAEYNATPIESDDETEGTALGYKPIS